MFHLPATTLLTTPQHVGRSCFLSIPRLYPCYCYMLPFLTCWPDVTCRCCWFAQFSRALVAGVSLPAFTYLPTSAWRDTTTSSRTHGRTTAELTRAGSPAAGYSDVAGRTYSGRAPPAVGTPRHQHPHACTAAAWFAFLPSWRAARSWQVLRFWMRGLCVAGYYTWTFYLLPFLAILRR